MLGSTVGFLGAQEDVVSWYNSGKVFILTSEREGFPFSFVEAMMCGMPCIVSNCGDIMDVARNRENALVIQQYGDIDGFAGAINVLLEDGDLRATLGHNAQGTAQTLGNDSVTADWEAILGKVVG